jgi:predicted flap endonuclease-1-like 5' DNA nuclease
MKTRIIQESDAVIAARAYQIWEEEGRPNGRHEIHWQRAVEDLATQPSQALSHLVDTVRAVPTTSVRAVAANQSAATEDVSLIDGVGPKLVKDLASFGITKLTQIATMMDADLAKIDAKLELKGRSAREEWIAQAKSLVAGGTPRAKVDQAKLAKKK